MGFFRLLRSSVYDREFYARVEKKRAISALGYFALLLFIVSLLFSVRPIVDIATFIFQPSHEKEQLRNEILSLYPDELVVRFEKEGASTNVAEPYAIPFPTKLLDDPNTDTEAFPKNLIVIDTGREISVGDFDRLDTAAILGKNSIGFYDAEKGKAEIQSLSEFSLDGFTLDKYGFTSLVGIVEKFAKGIGIALLFLIPLLIFSATFSWYLLYLLFGALIIWIIASVRGAGWGYGTSYKAGLYLMTLSILYSLASSFIFPATPHIPFIFTAILAIITILNIPKKAPSENPPTENTAVATPE